MNEKEKTFNGKIAGKFNIFFLEKLKVNTNFLLYKNKIKSFYYDLVLQKF